MAGTEAATAPARLELARRRAAEGDLEGALAEARTAARADRSLSEAFAIWGIAACELGLFADAIEPLTLAADRVPRGSVGWANVTSQLARAFSYLGYWSHAASRAAAVEAIDPPDPPVRQRIGAAFARVGLIDRGLAHLEWAVKARPDLADARHDLGLAYLSVGRADEAEQALAAAIRLAPGWVQPHVTLAYVRRWTAGTGDPQGLRARFEDQTLALSDRIGLGFALFKVLDDLGRPDEAWPVLEAANALAAAADPWSADQERALVDALIESFPVERFAGLERRPQGPGPTPIFVVGLPRSGTSLVERIFAAHSKVAGWGEPPAFQFQFREASRAQDRQKLTAELVRRAAGADWRRVAQAYLKDTAYLHAPDKPFAVDKVPANSLVAGALRLAFPNSPIVWVRRAPMDTLFSCYRIPIGGAYGWSSRFEDLAAHWAEHERLMAHWRSALGAGFVELVYEDLVADPEPHIRRLLQACGLEFEPGCLNPERSEGAVRTASMTQVREPISARGIGAWRAYAERLKPLRARLEAQGAT
jgi:tetratricopeptide (TPR) repeat protein